MKVFTGNPNAKLLKDPKKVRTGKCSSCRKWEALLDERYLPGFFIDYNSVSKSSKNYGTVKLTKRVHGNRSSQNSEKSMFLNADT